MFKTSMEVENQSEVLHYQHKRNDEVEIDVFYYDRVDAYAVIDDDEKTQYRDFCVMDPIIIVKRKRYKKH